MNVTVITGASMGLGEEFARQLAARKHNLVLVARSRERLETLAGELEARHGVRAVPFVCNLSEPAASEKVAAFLDEKNLTPTWLINNAGFGRTGEFADSTLEQVRGMMMVNMVVLTELTHLLLPRLRLHRESQIINVASMAAFQPIPYFQVYAATKTYVLMFSEALREELRGTDVRVQALCPGPTKTSFGTNNEISTRFLESGKSSHHVVRMSLAGTERNRAVVLCDRRWLVFLMRFVPRIAVRRLAGIFARKIMMP